MHYYCLVPLTCLRAEEHSCHHTECYRKRTGRILVLKIVAEVVGSRSCADLTNKFQAPLCCATVGTKVKEYSCSNTNQFPGLPRTYITVRLGNQFSWPVFVLSTLGRYLQPQPRRLTAVTDALERKHTKSRSNLGTSKKAL